MLVLAALVVVMAGCEDSETEDDRSGSERMTRSSTAGDGDRNSTVGVSEDSDGTIADVLDGREARTLPDGTVIYPAPAPTNRQVPASNGCSRSQVRLQDGQTEIRSVPPAPGLRAKYAGPRKVEVFVTPGKPPERCRPDFVNILVDYSRDSYPPIARTVRLRGDRTMRLIVPLFKQMTLADSARATTGMNRGATGPTAKVRISR